MKTSEQLRQFEVYSRAELAEKFRITDMTLNTGIFQPAGHDSVWLFITEDKPADRTQYRDCLTGDELHWEGQTSGRKDALIINHRAKGLELLVFYRKFKNEHDNCAFRCEGPFEYVSHERTQPAAFRLRRVKSSNQQRTTR